LHDTVPHARVPNTTNTYTCQSFFSSFTLFPSFAPLLRPTLAPSTGMPGRMGTAFEYRTSVAAMLS